MTLNKKEHIHFIGIGGYGMSAIALVMLEMGFTVTGSDVDEQNLTEKLRQQGATIYIGHDPAYVQHVDTVVYSTACSKENIERVAAEKRGIPVMHRSQMLARLLNTKKGIAVAGAHGKTTTSSMIAFILTQCGVSPTYVIGGEVTNLGTNAQAGQGEYIVVEADESDGSFLNYDAHIAVVTNIEADHLENYNGSFDRLKEAYIQFLSQCDIDGTAVLCMDDLVVREMVAHLKTNMVTYGIEQSAHYMATDLIVIDHGMTFTMHHQNQTLGTVHLSIPGKHNVLNAMAAIIVSMRVGVSFTQAVAALYHFVGAKRRFQIIGEQKGIRVVDDYAHHPTEIVSTLTAAKSTGRRIIAIFQPQRYSRLYFLFEQFSRAFGGADELILVDVYAPVGEKIIPNIDSPRLVECIQKNSNKKAQYIGDKYKALAYVKTILKSGDLVLTMGAGDIWKVAHKLVDILK